MHFYKNFFHLMLQELSITFLSWAAYWLAGKAETSAGKGSVFIFRLKNCSEKEPNSESANLRTASPSASHLQAGSQEPPASGDQERLL